MLNPPKGLPVILTSIICFGLGCTTYRTQKMSKKQFYELEGSIGPDDPRPKKVRVTTYTYTVKEYIFDEDEDEMPEI